MNYINAIETGLSSDLLMVKGISELNNVSIIPPMIFRRIFKNY